MRVTMDLEVHDEGGPDDLIRYLQHERAAYYPEWQFDRTGIEIITKRTHASASHWARATLEKWVPVAGLG